MRKLFWRRSSAAHWALAVVMGIVTTVAVARSLGQSRALIDRYGYPVTVVVAERDLEMGDVVEAADVVERLLPSSAVPTSVYRQSSEVVGRTVLAPAVAGLPLVRRHLAPESAAGIGALLQSGLRAVSVPRNDSSVPVIRGDRVDVLATLDPAAAPGLEPTFAVARRAVVLDVSEAAAVVAVSPEEAKRVAYAVAQGVVTLAIVPLTPDPAPDTRPDSEATPDPGP